MFALIELYAGSDFRGEMSWENSDLSCRSLAYLEQAS
jgi:hypothetical protein